ncbi:MAG: KUP/HAK/KT family potassium transporter, partial [Casimicrobiaceae bacterium]
QAMQLGFLPRMSIRHTSARIIGQIYVPTVNWLLLAIVAAAVIGFGSSDRLASAYGIAVMGTMLVTTVLMWFVLRDGWRYPLWLCVASTGFFLLVDVAFFGAALHKVSDGGWFPLALGAIAFLVMTTWRRGRALLAASVAGGSPPLSGFLGALFLEPPPRVPGTAVFLTSSPDTTPSALLHSLKHYKVLHEQNIFLTVEFRDIPWVSDEHHVITEPMGHNCWRVRTCCGFMQQPDVAHALALCAPSGLQVDPMQVSYFLSREQIVPGLSRRGIVRWRDQLFGMLARNAGRIADYFNIPANRTVELGTRIEF